LKYIMDAPTSATEHGWVKVTNIAPAATSDEIKALFGFCGFVNAIHLTKADDDTQSAVIEFYDKTAVSTAALLTNAIIQDRAIKVELYIATPQEQDTLLTTQAGVTKPTGVDPIAHQSKTAVMAKLLASGHKLAGDVKGKAVAWDTGSLNLIQKLEALGQTVSTQANEINAKYGLSEKGQAVLNVASGKAIELGQTIASTTAYQVTLQKATEIDEKLQFTKKATELYDMAKSKATKLVDETNKEIANLQQQQAQQAQQEQQQPQLHVQVQTLAEGQAPAPQSNTQTAQPDQQAPSQQGSLYPIS